MNLKDFEIMKFPDGHKHIKNQVDVLHPEKEIGISISIKSFDDLFLLAQLKSMRPNLKILRINYLLAARCDRRFSENEALDLEIVANFINNLKFNKIDILRPHSAKSLELINHSSERDLTSAMYVRCLLDNKIGKHSIIVPDKGASKWVTNIIGHEDVIQCEKKRDENGKIVLTEVLGVPHETCIIIDDLCDAGGTFLGIAEALKAKGVKDIYLIVTHFIGGHVPFEAIINLKKDIKMLYTTNSFDNYREDSFFKVTDVN